MVGRQPAIRVINTHRLNRRGNPEWWRRCQVCGYARINVRHNTTPQEQAPEGPAYYRDMTDLHEFVPSDRFTR